MTYANGTADPVGLDATRFRNQNRTRGLRPAAPGARSNSQDLWIGVSRDLLIAS